MSIVSRHVSITGSSFYPGATDAIKRFMPGLPLILTREPTNKYDPNAVAVNFTHKTGKVYKVGHVPRGLAAELAPLMDAGTVVKAVRARTALEGVMLLQWDDGQ